MTRSSSARACSTPNLYWKPEQPPPSTLTRSMEPAGSVLRISPIRRAARSLTVTLKSIACPFACPIVKCGLQQGQCAMTIETGRKRADYAADPALSRGRLHAEAPSPTRNEFRRDCDRIIHSTAFRRLAHKTQVFVYHEGDHYRTRLTHTLEVAQIARSLARALGLDEDLAEALALAHDLGDPPFGHAGERALDQALNKFGSFDHNAQALRIVTDLERRYAAFDGLNLTWETLEGLVKHNGPLTDREGRAVGRH